MMKTSGCLSILHSMRKTYCPHQVVNRKKLVCSWNETNVGTKIASVSKCFLSFSPIKFSLEPKIPAAPSGKRDKRG